MLHYCRVTSVQNPSQPNHDQLRWLQMPNCPRVYMHVHVPACPVCSVLAQSLLRLAPRNQQRYVIGGLIPWTKCNDDNPPELRFSVSLVRFGFLSGFLAFPLRSATFSGLFCSFCLFSLNAFPVDLEFTLNVYTVWRVLLCLLLTLQSDLLCIPEYFGFGL